MTTKRETNISFDSADAMANAFRELGIDINDYIDYTCWMDGAIEVDSSTMKALERHGIYCEKKTEKVRNFGWKAADKIKEAYLINGSVEFWSCSFTVMTYDKTVTEHKAEVRKVYRLLKTLSGYDIRRGCDYERGTGTCGTSKKKKKSKTEDEEENGDN